MAESAMLEADYVIVGAGSAGCALAYRLSEDGRHSVLVLEYGGSDIGPLIQMPAAFSIPMNMRTYDWGYESEPEPHLGGRKLHAPRGKVVGGSSSINGMVFVRGHAADFDRWEEQGAKGWGFPQRAPLFQAHGDRASQRKRQRQGERQWRRRARLARHRRAAATSRAGPCRTRSIAPSPMPAPRPAIPSPPTITARSRRASARWR